MAPTSRWGIALCTVGPCETLYLVLRGGSSGHARAAEVCAFVFALTLCQGADACIGNLYKVFKQFQ